MLGMEADAVAAESGAIGAGVSRLDWHTREGQSCMFSSVCSQTCAVDTLFCFHIVYAYPSHRRAKRKKPAAANAARSGRIAFAFMSDALAWILLCNLPMFRGEVLECDCELRSGF